VIDTQAGNIPAPKAAAESIQTPPEPREAAQTPQETSSQAGPSAGGMPEALLALANAERNLFHALAQALSARSDQPAAPHAARVERDAQTGEPYLRFPLPSPDKLKRVLATVAELLK
jgi:hypothetical protein